MLWQVMEMPMMMAKIEMAPILALSYFLVEIVPISFGPSNSKNDTFLFPFLKYNLLRLMMAWDYLIWYFLNKILYTTLWNEWKQIPLMSKLGIVK